MHVYPLTDRRGKLEFKYAFGRALGPCLRMLRDVCVNGGGCGGGEGVLICDTSATGDWAAGLAIAWLAWHCRVVVGGADGDDDDNEQSSAGDDDGNDAGGDDTRLYGLCLEQQQDDSSGDIGKDMVQGTMIRFLSSFPRYHLSRATLKQLNRFFSSPMPSSTVDR